MGLLRRMQGLLLLGVMYK
ncbi:hypothetical protein Goklo_009844 [Gossypium klotzschianum]|uniref:Uncharacterized protein n=1 Tax=Gossypium klotzschianum TaxID=34286 RepID=A0A7J8V4U2_9ROSI|nr:hypothetical protein [Gossypium klotzschianum]